MRSRPRSNSVGRCSRSNRSKVDKGVVRHHRDGEVHHHEDKDGLRWLTIVQDVEVWQEQDRGRRYGQSEKGPDAVRTRSASRLATLRRR